MGKAGKKCLFCSGLSSGPNFRFGTGSRGIEISRDFPGRNKKGFLWTGLNHHGIKREIWTGLRFHGIARDGIKIPRDCTGRNFTGQKTHGTPRDLIEISRDFTGRNFTGRKKHGTPRDGIEISRDCTVILSRSGF